MNIENKKQLATILLAVGLGLVAAILTAKHVENSVNERTKELASDYKKKTAVLVNELEQMKKSLNTVKKQQADLAKQQEQLKVTARSTKGGASAAPTAPVQMESFSLLTPPGKRAITILIDSLSAVGGLINPGDFVDIHADLKVPDPKSKDKKKTTFNNITTVLFQNVQVLAVGTNYRPIGKPPQYEQQHRASKLRVTLAFTPEEANLLNFAQDHGKLSMTLRSPAEQETAQDLKVASWDVLAEFVKKSQGTDILVPKEEVKAPEAVVDEEPEEDTEGPSIEIFKSGKQTRL